MQDPVDWSSVSEAMLDHMAEGMRFVVRYEEDHRWRWSLLTAAGDVVAVCDREGFPDKTSCLTGIGLAKRTRYTPIDELL